LTRSGSACSIESSDSAPDVLGRVSDIASLLGSSPVGIRIAAQKSPRANYAAGFRTAGDFFAMQLER
jgi:hypothetical protein